MKKFILPILFMAVVFCKAQQSNNVAYSVEKSVFGIQTGILGIWGNNELKLSNTIALKNELGFDSGIWNSSYKKMGFVLVPTLTLEPRLYYNLKKRVASSRNINGNSGNFIALRTSFHPNWFIISNHQYVRITSDISIIPTWGIKRHIGKHFNFETGLGLGYQHYFAENMAHSEDKNKAVLNLHLRIGYSFIRTPKN